MIGVNVCIGAPFESSYRHTVSSVCIRKIKSKHLIQE
jgi:hypothetical protein